MAVTLSPQSSPISSTKIVTDSDCDATAEANVTGAASTVYMIDIDNTANGSASYFKAWDAASPTVGTTAPDLILPVAASVRRVFSFPDGIAFATALSFACCTTAGTAGTTNPTSNVIVRIVCT